MTGERKKGLVVETIEFHGHPNILGTHYNTIEITRVDEISKRADCIIGVSASKACSDLSPLLKRHIQAGGHLIFEIKVGATSFAFTGKGRKELQLTDPDELVVRRSDFVSDRTAAVSCDAAATDIPRKMIRLLQEKHTTGVLTISAADIPTQSDEIQFPLLIES